MRTKPSLVYFVRRTDGEGPIKIGCSQVPIGRLHQLTVWSPYPLSILATIPGDERLEWRFHARFAAQHSHREWFHPSPELEAMIQRIVRGRFDIGTLPAPRRLNPPRLGKKWGPNIHTRLENRLKKLRELGIEGPEVYPPWKERPAWEVRAIAFVDQHRDILKAQGVADWRKGVKPEAVAA